MTKFKDAVQVYHAIEALKKGETLTYWVSGSLDRDCEEGRNAKRARSVRDGARDACENELCSLVQKRMTIGQKSEFAYLAQRR